ncbi:hypothetical protein Tco_0690436 [Tanacetum coccineum]
MTTLVEFKIIVGVENCPPMLEKNMYDSWKSRMELYMENRENGRMILDSVQNGPLVWPTIVHKDGTTRSSIGCLAILMVTQGDDLIACLNKAMTFLSAVAASRFPSTNNQLRTSSNPRNQATIQDGRVILQQEGRQGLLNAIIIKVKDTWLDEEQLAFLADPGILDGQAAQTTIPNNVAFQTEDLDAYDSNCDDVSNAKAALMANLSNYDSDFISEVPHFESYPNDLDNQSVHAMQDFEQMLAAIQDTKVYAQQYSMILSVIEKMYEQMINHPTLYDGSVISIQHAVILVIDDEETLILEELNQLSKDFGKRFVPQQELSAKQAFWLQTSHPNTGQSDISLVKIEAPRELPKVSLVNTSIKKLKYHLGKFDTMVKKWITPDVITEGECGFEHIKAVFLNEIIPFLKTLKDIFDIFDKDILNEVTEVQTVFNQMEADVQQCSEHIKSMRENDKEEKVKEDIIEIETINIELEHNQFDSIKKTRVRYKEHSESLIAHLNSKSVENADLKSQIQDKVFVITLLKNNLRKLKGKEVVDNAAQMPNATTMFQGCKMFTKIGYKWKPTRRLFTLVGNMCPLTRFTSTKVVPLKETTYHSVEAHKPKLKVYNKRPKLVKSGGSSKKSKIVDSRIANNSEPNHSWGSNATNVPSSSSLVNDRLSRLFSGIWTLDTQNI